MNPSKEKGYTKACKDLLPTAQSCEDLIQKVFKKFKIKHKKDKGWHAVRVAAKREWDKHEGAIKTSKPKKPVKEEEKEDEKEEEDLSDYDEDEEEPESEEESQQGEEVNEEGKP